MTRKLIAAGTLQLVVVTFTAFSWAQGNGTSSEEIFSALDVNDDGNLSADDIGDDQKQFFERVLRRGDSNGDGILTRDEFVQGNEKREPPADDRPGPYRDDSRGNRRHFDPGQFFERLDADRDGLLTHEEIPELLMPQAGWIFDRLGKDAISLEDLQQVRRTMTDNPGGRNGRGSQTDPEAMFDIMDANRDGRLSVNEVPLDAQDRLRNSLRELGRTEDDSMSREEFSDFVGRVRGDSPNRQSGDPDGPRPDLGPGLDGPSNMRGGHGGPPPVFRALDENDDGRISEEELNGAAAKLMKLDHNQNGSLEPQELFGFGPGGGSGEEGPRRRGRRPDSGRGSFERPRK